MNTLWCIPKYGTPELPESIAMSQKFRQNRLKSRSFLGLAKASIASAPLNFTGLIAVQSRHFAGGFYGESSR